MQSGSSQQTQSQLSITSQCCNTHGLLYPQQSFGWTTGELNDIGISKIMQTQSVVSGSETCHQNNPQKQPDYLAWRRLHVSKAKLAGVGEIATFLAGFAVVATVELQINDDANPVLLLAFTVTTALLVCTTMMSIMISTCILPHITVS